MASNTCLAAEKPGGPSGVATLTGEIRDPASREITFAFQAPVGLGISRQRVVLDSLNRFAIALPVNRGSRVWVSYDGGKPRWEWLHRLGALLFDRDPLVLFVEPGDSLHVVAEEGFFGPSHSLSGPSADNSRFFAEWSQRLYSFRPDYKDLQVEDFSRQVEQWRRDRLEFLAEGREKYTLSPGFVEHAMSQVKYKWAGYMISYPANYRFANGHENQDITPEYFAFLQEIPLVDEKAIGVVSYHTYLERVLGRELSEVSEAVDRSRLSDTYDLSGLELSDEILARMDSIYEEEGSRPRLSKMVDLSAVGLSPEDQARLDSLYANRQPLKLSEKLDLAALGLSEAAQAKSDSINGAPGGRIEMSWFEKQYDLAREKLEGRVLYWFLAGMLVDGFANRGEAFAEVRGKWEDFQQINPYPEYTEAVQMALDRALKVQPGRPAPDFTLPDLDGRPVSLSQFKGKVVLLDFWASWCRPCIADLPHLKKIKERMAAQPVVFVNLSLDEKERDWRKAVEEHGIQGLHVRAPGVGAEVARDYNVSGIPSYFLLDSKGMIVERVTGRIGEVDAVVAKIEKVLGRSPVSTTGFRNL